MHLRHENAQVRHGGFDFLNAGVGMDGMRVHFAAIESGSRQDDGGQRSKIEGITSMAEPYLIRICHPVLPDNVTTVIAGKLTDKLLFNYCIRDTCWRIARHETPRAEIGNAIRPGNGKSFPHRRRIKPRKPA